MNDSSLSIGLNSALPYGTATAWGAKALWNRSPGNAFKVSSEDSFGPDSKKLKAWLNANIKDIRRAFSEACHKKQLTLGGHTEVTLFEDDGYKIVVSPAGSHSHVQLAAWKKWGRRWY